MILYIDTTDFNSAMFGLFDGKKLRKKIYKINPHKSHETLGKLEEFLKAVKLVSTSPAPRGRSGHPPHASSFAKASADKLGRGIRKIYVNKGPGSYTGVRIGVTIAMALGFAWGVPVKAVVNDKFKVK